MAEKRKSPKKTSKKREYILLPNGCYRTPFRILPSDWNKSSAKTTEDWILYYRYYDPAIKFDPKDPATNPLQRIKGMNKFHDLEQRRAETQSLLASESDLIDKMLWNPLKKAYDNSCLPILESIDPKDISENTPLNTALKWAFDHGDLSTDFKVDVKSKLKYFSLASARLGFSDKPVKEIRRKHIKKILDAVGAEKLSTVTVDKKGNKKNGVWTASLYNHFLGNIGSLFKVLDEYEATDHNPCHGITKKKEVIKQRATLTDAERLDVHRVLIKSLYTFWRFIQIFFHSGARRKELMLVKKSDVDLSNQRFKVTTLKGGTHREVWKPIKDIVLPLWKSLMYDAAIDDYLFGEGLKPAVSPIRPEQVTRRWKRHVKDKMGIEADLYSLRHLNLTEMMDLLSESTDVKKAQEIVIESSSHTTTKMLDTVYDVRSQLRKDKRIKAMGNKFA